jgi:phage terminase large subunit-like protein
MSNALQALLPANATADDVQRAVAEMPIAEATAMLFAWREFWARPEQLLPRGEFSTWVILAGRGFGKSRSGAEAVREIVEREPGQRIALVGPTAADCRDVMIEGESGLLNVFPPAQRPIYRPSKRLVQFANGSQGFVYSAEEPERLRGPQHHGAWCDELATYKHLTDLWTNLRFGLRLGTHPQTIVTTTPKPLSFLKELIADAATVTTRGKTVDNAANLPASVLREFERVYGGTRIGRQELEGELLEEAEGALWNRAQIDKLRVSKAPELVRIVVAIDPSVTAGPDSDECGIVAAGLGVDGDGYLLRDGSARLAPDAWAHRAVSMFDALDADRIIAEVNNGGDLVESVLRTVRKSIAYQKINASRGKVARAEPIAALYEQGRVHHVGAFRELEDEQCTFVPGALTKSPNRADALVWALTWLMLKPAREGRAFLV